MLSTVISVKVINEMLDILTEYVVFKVCVYFTMLAHLSSKQTQFKGSEATSGDVYHNGQCGLR